MPNEAVRIVIIEDELPIRRFLRAALQAQGFDLEECPTAREGLAEISTRPPDLVILDLGLPDMDGLDVIKRLREWTNLPILVLSARGQESDKIDALDIGADDYLTKPFGMGELLARVRVALRNSSRSSEPAGEAIIRVGSLEIDMARRNVRIDSREIKLTPIEYRLLTTLARHQGKVLTHQQLLKEVWGPRAAGENHYLRVYMGHLRHKVEPDPARPRYLLTEPGVGYRLAAD